MCGVWILTMVVSRVLFEMLASQADGAHGPEEVDNIA
jgi:hypothetical protein